MTLVKRYQQKIAQARALADQHKDADVIPADVAAQITSLLGEADEIKARIDLENRIAGGEEFLGGSGGLKAAHLGWRDAGPDEGALPTDPKAWREMEVKTPFGVQKVRYNVPLAVQRDGYAGAFESYLRNGKNGLGPNDAKTLSEGVDTAGGFTVPEDFQMELLRKKATMATFRAMARVVTTSRDSVAFPFVNYTTDDEYSSPVRLTWVGEIPASATTHRVTDPTFGLKDIPVNTAMASQPISNNLIEDSAFDILGYSSAMLAEAFALGENNVFWNGSGAGQPMGLLTEVDTNGPDSVASGTSGAISTSGDGSNDYRIKKLFYTLPAQYRMQGVWSITSLTALAIEALVDANERTLIQASNAGSLAQAMGQTIMNRPVNFDEFVPEIAANAYPIVFGDMKGYVIVDRVGFSIQRLDELYAETNTTLLLARQRVGGYCVEPWRIKVLKCSA